MPWLDVVGKGDALALCLVLAQGLELFAALDHELVFVVMGWGNAGGGGRIRLAGHRAEFRGKRCQKRFERYISKSW